MSRRLPPLNALRAFEAAGRHQSFSRAAEELGVNHSAISRHVRGLEDRLNAQLFRDENRGVALTQAGQRYLAQVSPAFDQIAEASADFTDRPQGMVTVNAEPLFATKLLVPRLGEFYAKFPEIELRLEASKYLADVDRYEADLAIRYFKDGCPDPACPMISDAPMYPFAAPALCQGQPDDPRDLHTYPLLRDRSTDVWSLWWAKQGITVPPVSKSSWRQSAILSVEAAVAGHGVIMVAADIVDGDVQAGRLIRMSDVGLRMGAYHLVLGEGVTRRRPVRHFRDWLLDVMAPFRGQAMLG